MDILTFVCACRILYGCMFKFTSTFLHNYSHETGLPIEVCYTSLATQCLVSVALFSSYFYPGLAFYGYLLILPVSVIVGLVDLVSDTNQIVSSQVLWIAISLNYLMAHY